MSDNLIQNDIIEIVSQNEQKIAGKIWNRRKQPPDIQNGNH